MEGNSANFVELLMLFVLLARLAVMCELSATRSCNAVELSPPSSPENEELVKLLTSGEGGAFKCLKGSGERSGVLREDEDDEEEEGRNEGLPC